MTEMNWQLIRVHGIDELVAAMERAEEKGYLPDAIKEAWNNFALDVAPTAALESRVLAERKQESVEQRLIDDSNGAWAAFERSEYADMSNRADLWPVWQDAWNAHPTPDAPQSQGEKVASEDVRTARYEWMLKMLMADGWTERGIDKEIAAIAGEKK